MKCPECKEEIEDGARKCKLCGSPTTKWLFLWEAIKDVVRFATFIAAIAVLVLMWRSNLIMKHSVDQARESVDQGKQALELTKVSVAKIDTGFALTRQQIAIANEQLNLAKKSVEQLSKEFIEEKRPRIIIATTQIDLSDTSWVFYFDFKNIGFADAEDILAHFVLKYEDSHDDTVYSDFEEPPKITKVSVLTQMWSVPVLNRVNLICLVEVRYSWIMQDLNYIEKKFLRYVYDEEGQEYIIRVLSKDGIERLWK